MRESKAVTLIPYGVVSGVPPAFAGHLRVSAGGDGFLSQPKPGSCFGALWHSEVYSDLSAIEGGGYSPWVVDPDADGGNPALDQDSALAASDGAWAPPVTKVPYVARWTSTHAPSDAAAAKWQALAQQRKFTEVHMPSCFVPMEAVHRADESDRVTLFVGSHNLTRASQANHECVVQLGTERREYRFLPGVVHSLVGRLVPYSD